jgi:hypothetical protein
VVRGIVPTLARCESFVAIGHDSLSIGRHNVELATAGRHRVRSRFHHHLRPTAQWLIARAEMERRPDVWVVEHRAVFEVMVSELETGRGSVLHAHLKHALGYRVDAPGEGNLGRVQGVPLAGQPPEPLVLIVSDGKTVRFVSLRRVAAVLQSEQHIVLGPRPAVPVLPTHTETARQAA